MGGVDGLLHVGEMSWSRLSSPGEFVKIGQEVQVKVLRIDRETRKISLGLKQLTPSPWDLVEDNYSRGMTVRGQGHPAHGLRAPLHVELEPGIEGTGPRYLRSSPRTGSVASPTS